VSIARYLGTEPLHELARYSARGRFAAEEKLILISDPFSAQTAFYEFRLEDVRHVEELPSLVTESGESLTMVRLWVKKGALGLRYEPFLVADTISSVTLHGGRERPPGT
jgi:hypothetical protein